MLEQMNRRLQFAAFLTVATLIAMLPGYYVGLRLFTIFGLAPGPLFWTAVIVLALLFLAGMGLPAVNDRSSLRALNIALGVWVGFFLILLFLLIFLDIARFFLAWLDYRKTGVAVTALALVLALIGAVNARFVRTRRLKVPAGGIGKPVRIVLLSDLHLGPVLDLAYFRRVVGRANRENPDVVLITGDLIDGKLTDEMFAPINELNAPVFFSPGNHEEYVGMEEFLRHLRRTKARPLLDEKVDMGGYELAGINFSWDKGRFDAMIAKVVPSGGKYSILMSHGPPAFDAARRAGFDLTVAGHTHGGQFWPFTAFGRLFVRYRVGMYERDDKRLFVTAGTGTWGPPLRLGSSSEIAVLDIG